MLGSIKKNSKCRICKSQQVYKVFSLGQQPLANKVLTKEQLTEKEIKYPLDLHFCTRCYLLQLIDIVNPKLLFQDYAYYTGASKPLVSHFQKLAKEVIEKYKLNENSLVVEIGSNDGTCLENFQNAGIKVVGVEPSINVGKVALEKGIPVFSQFWDCECRKEVENRYGNADIIIATNVLAHINALSKFVQNIYFLLKPDGKFIFEIPYLENLLEKVEYDTIYHEHLSYFSLPPLITLFQSYNMEITEVKRLSMHGGSIRVTAQKKIGKTNLCNPNIQTMLVKTSKDITKIETYIDFGIKAKLKKRDLTNRLNFVKAKGYKVIGYGATAKGNVLLNYCNISNNMLEYIVDTTKYKQGKYTPGTHIPIISDREFLGRAPKYTLLLAWNYQKEIMKKEKKYIENGGTFILPHQL